TCPARHPPRREGERPPNGARTRGKAAGEVTPPSNALPGPAPPGRPVCAPVAMSCHCTADRPGTEPAAIIRPSSSENTGVIHEPVLSTRPGQADDIDKERDGQTAGTARGPRPGKTGGPPAADD